MWVDQRSGLFNRGHYAEDLKNTFHMSNDTNCTPSRLLCAEEVRTVSVSGVSLHVARQCLEGIRHSEIKVTRVVPYLHN